MAKKKMSNLADKEIKEQIAKNIKIARIKLRGKISMQTIANSLNMTRVAYSQIENGRNNVNGVTLWKLSSLLGCEMSGFFPKRLEGVALSKTDIENIKSEDEKILEWGKILGWIA
ncbi:MAG: helix-turn-helix transcriptional regulator [Candidatus Magasanikbacteria bacterium]|nr:helix-turn-helix transcriptional regulator [Candidatus Magasanikbacteria bacterium]